MRRTSGHSREKGIGKMSIRTFVAIACAIVLNWGANARADDKTPPPIPEKIDFNRDVRPILSDHCYSCHGPDKKARKAKLRLDTKEGIESDHVVVAGRPGDSELYARVVSDDDDERMPPPKSAKKLGRVKSPSSRNGSIKARFGKAIGRM